MVLTFQDKLDADRRQDEVWHYPVKVFRFIVKTQQLQIPK